MPSDAVRHFARNIAGRDFCIGDVHGLFGDLERLLDKVGFDPARDRLFSVGDLIDRGPASARITEFIDQPWFHACRGNHEQMLLDACAGGTLGTARALWAANGGDWWRWVAPEQRGAIRAACERLPYALDIEADRGRIGVVHADVPEGTDWPAFLARLTSPNDEDARTHALWSRRRLHADLPPVAGVTEVLCGHTPVPEPRMRGNVTFIDTGGFIGQLPYGRLTVYQLQPQGGFTSLRIAAS